MFRRRPTGVWRDKPCATETAATKFRHWCLRKKEGSGPRDHRRLGDKAHYQKGLGRHVSMPPKQMPRLDIGACAQGRVPGREIIGALGTRRPTKMVRAACPYAAETTATFRHWCLRQRKVPGREIIGALRTRRPTNMGRAACLYAAETTATFGHRRLRPRKGSGPEDHRRLEDKAPYQYG